MYFNNECDCSKAESLRLELDDKAQKKLAATAKKAFAHLHKKGSYKPEDLTEKPYQALIKDTKDAFNFAIQDNKVPADMLQSLQEDVFLFSGLKTHAQLFEASRMLLTDDGKRKPYSQFEKDVTSIDEKYNNTYLQAEYLFATGSAQMASNWANFSDSERYNLQYRTAEDSRVRDTHASLNSITLPKNHPFWDLYAAKNGWNCRCRMVEVRAIMYPATDSAKAMSLGEAATTQIGKDGKNKLAIFRFNSGKQKVIFPPDHPYNKIAGADKAKQVLGSSAVNLKELIKGDLPTNAEIKTIFTKYADEYPEDFRNGLKEFKFQKSTSYMMQHSMAYKPSTGEWSGGSSLTVSTHKFSSINFNPAEELRNGLGAMKKGGKLTFNQEYAFESMWHEILHAKTKTKPARLNTVQVKNMETINQFVARSTYHTFIERLGGKAEHQEQILNEGYGYKSWITEFRTKVAENKKSDKEALEFFEPHLMNDYGSIGKKMYEFFNQ